MTDEQAAQLAELEKIRDAPDEPAGSSRSEVLNITVDLGDPEAVERALKLGWLKAEDVEDDDDDDNGGDNPNPKTEKTPKRRGYFEGKE